VEATRASFDLAFSGSPALTASPSVRDPPLARCRCLASCVIEVSDADADADAVRLSSLRRDLIPEVMPSIQALALLPIRPFAASRAPAPTPPPVNAAIAVRRLYSFTVSGSTTPGAFSPRRVKGGVIVYGLFTYHELSFAGDLAAAVAAGCVSASGLVDECRAAEGFFKIDFGRVGGGARMAGGGDGDSGAEGEREAGAAVALADAEARPRASSVVRAPNRRRLRD
jgi:hypothetical protein